MRFLYLLESVRVPILNEFMLLVTQLGEETAFLVAALILFWCIDKYKGYYVLTVGFVGTLTNQFLKLLFRIPRPWILDKKFTILEQAREAASGYSFPSGHTQSAVGTFGAIAYTVKNRWVKYLCVSAAILVPFSRMYIGVHTPMDVFVSAAIACLLVVVMKPLVLENFKRAFPWIFGAMLTASIAFLCYVEFYKFPADMDAHNLASGIKNAYTLDEKWLSFTTKAVWWAQALKVIGGLALVLIVKSGLKTPLNSLLGDSVGRSVRYFLIVVFAGVLWPLTFKFFSKLGVKNER